jgi:F0F1-type ATP synthase membrane subunit c/vacuolar-type H+-ATPase subunit K
MERKMRQFGIVATSVGTIGVIIFGLLLVQVMDDPKARTALLKWGFILMALLGGMGVYALSFALSKPKRARGEDSSAPAS